MKHFFTKEKELTMFVNAFPEFNVSALFTDEISRKVINHSVKRNQPTADLPDPQIISNILNYARSLEVLKPATGAAMFFINN
jgi:hypothetical protein